jgi:hypothetical protein
MPLFHISIGELIPIVRIWNMYFIPLTLLSSLMAYTLISIWHSAYKELFSLTKRIINLKLLYKGRLIQIKLSMLIFFMISILVTSAPLLIVISYTHLQPINYLPHAEALQLQKKYNLITQDDLSLMMWAKNNLNGNSIIFILDKGGLYVEPVTGIKTIFPYCALTYAISYRSLLRQIHEGSIDATLIDGLRKFNITYIFISSRSNIEVELFVKNPHFILIKQIGECYLIKVDYGMKESLM